MKKQLLILSLLLMTGCVENIKEQKKEEPKKRIEIVKNVKHYTKKQLELKKYFDEYLKRLSSLDTDGVIYMTYPKFFIPINKTIFKRYLNNLLTSPHIAVVSFDTNITDIGRVKSYNNGEFANLKYQTTINLAFINPNLYNDELSIRMLRDILSKKYGKENIQIEPKNREITIREEQKLLAIKDNSSLISATEFIGDNPEYRKLYPEIFPLDILSKI